MFKELYFKTIKLAGHKSSKIFLGIMSFIESFVFPIPPDVLIIPMTIAKKHEWLRIALIATICSVLGACLGYFIGYVFFNEVGIKIFEFFGAENANIFKEKLASEKGILSGILILFIAGFTPLPFKIITISSGFVHFDILFFIIICFLSRGLRFFLVSYLAYKYGAAIGPLLEKKGGLWTVIIAGVIVVIVMGFYYMFK